MNIAVLDNDSARCELISHTLGAIGHACHCFQQIDELLAHLCSDGGDMLIIDWQTAGGRGTALFATVRSEIKPDVPILLVADRGCDDDILAAQAAGANDYIIKPLRRGELLTRTRVLLKRAYPESAKPEQLHFAQYAFEPDTGLLSLAGAPIEVTHKEFALALLFFRHLDRPLSRAFIAEAVWPNEAEPSSRTIDTHVSRVRTKLGLRPENGFRLAPVYSYGYRLEQLSV